MFTFKTDLTAAAYRDLGSSLQGFGQQLTGTWAAAHRDLGSSLEEVYDSLEGKSDRQSPNICPSSDKILGSVRSPSELSRVFPFST